MTSLKQSRRDDRRSGSLRLAGVTLVTLTLAGLFVYFVEQTAAALLPDLKTSPDFFSAAGLIAFIIAGVFYWQHPRIMRQINAKVRTVDASGLTEQPYLICGYSPLKVDFPYLETLTRDLDEACAPTGPGYVLNSWQQNLRVLRKIPTIQHVYVLENDKYQFEEFSKVLRHFFPEDRLKITLIEAEQGGTTFKDDVKATLAPDYEDLRYVRRGIDRAIEMIARARREKEDDVEKLCIIDVTGGLKTFSIAAAIASLNRDLVFVYAGTGERTGDVLGYDATIELALRFEF
ncbi:hypothetical protein JMM61_18845 [Rhodovulum sulfidophilum]|uniref:hypothetical protein n=1 Tax=Rhodovulum sulfidophilum TaxID=35806 RepID=UPI001926D9E1|nr:hypothetical protein [Rhodovulum sulfidophilum]MBL3587410.1 hypothetical protein [Rhodovulum sulfidophilum]